jgi:hypothetical protein
MVLVSATCVNYLTITGTAVAAVLARRFVLFTGVLFTFSHRFGYLPFKIPLTH